MCRCMPVWARSCSVSRSGGGLPRRAADGDGRRRVSSSSFGSGRKHQSQSDHCSGTNKQAAPPINRPVGKRRAFSTIRPSFASLAQPSKKYCTGTASAMRASRYPVGAVLVFLHLLKTDPERFGELLLRHSCLQPPQAQSRGDMAINGVWTPRCHFSTAIQRWSAHVTAENQVFRKSVTFPP